MRTPFEILNDTYECKDFHDVDPNVSGVEVYKDDERIGSMVGISLPDLEDSEAVDHFRNELEIWLIDNE